MLQRTESARIPVLAGVTKENDTTNLSGDSGWVLFRKMVRQPQSPTISRIATAKRTNRVMHNPPAGKEKRLRAVCVFCGSSPGRDRRHAEAARELGTLLAANGFSLVFGGGNIGLMGEVARAARAGGAPVVGILPKFLEHLEPPLRSAEELIVTPDLQQRKQRMLALADAFVILPGGLGTLDEYFEVLTSAQLHALGKPILLVNIAGYFDPLKTLLDHVVREGFANPSLFELQQIVVDPKEAIATLLLKLPAAGTV